MEENHIPQNEAEVDSLLESIESPSEKGVETQAPTKEVTPPPTEQAMIEYELSRYGTKQKYPLDKVLNFAQQGLDYNEKMRDFKVQRGLFDTEKTKWETQIKNAQEIEKRLKEYQAIEEYNKKDPKWWEHVITSYQQRQKEQGQTAPLTNNPVIEKLAQDLESIKGDLTAQKEREKLIQKANEDMELEQSITDFKEKNNQFDWTTLDKDGLDLEKRVLKFAIENGMNSPKQFAIAARAYLHDEYLKRAELKSKEEVGKAIQKTTKLGLGPVKSEPTQKISRVKDIRSKSWEDIGAEALKELGVQ